MPAILQERLAASHEFFAPLFPGCFGRILAICGLSWESLKEVWDCRLKLSIAGPVRPHVKSILSNIIQKEVNRVTFVKLNFFCFYQTVLQTINLPSKTFCVSFPFALFLFRLALCRPLFQAFLFMVKIFFACHTLFSL